jgi:sugar phosphate isomerase/epimerase
LNLETIRNADKLGYDGIEAGVGFVGRSTLDEVEANLGTLREALANHRQVITSVAIYGGTIEIPKATAVAYYQQAFRVAQALDCGVVSCLTGRQNDKSIADNLPIFADYFSAICQIAEDQGIRLALEPWPGSVQGHGPYRWTNLATTPELYDMLFAAVDSPALGLEYDPSHYVWQGIDHLQVVRDYADRIYHMHAKDIVIDQAKLKKVGVHGRGWERFVIPGLGQINWVELFDTLKAVGYQGNVALEHEDREYLNERWNEGLSIAVKTLRPLVDAY